jgi:GAF domain-containing protein
MSAPYPTNEKERLQALFDFKILDTQDEAVYDAITLLASQIMQTPITAISFMDADRLWFKSKIGIDASEVPREETFCSYTLLNPHSPLIVNDATQDPRFCNNIHVLGGANVRFYFGMPISTSNDEVIGVLCGTDTTSRDLITESQLAALRHLSKLIMAQLEMRKFILEVHEKVVMLEPVVAPHDSVFNVYQALNLKCDIALDKIKV